MQRIKILEMFVGNKWMPEGLRWMIRCTLHSNVGAREKALTYNGEKMRMKWRKRVGNGGGCDVEDLTWYGHECHSPEGLTETLQTHSASTLEVLRAPAEF